MQDYQPRRSMLFVPGSHERAMQKAASLDADMIAFDLEDAVAPGAKAGARLRVAAYLSEMPSGGRPLAVRINGLDTLWGGDDLAMFAASKVDAILIPKVNEAKDIAPVQVALDKAGSKAAIWAMIETPLGVLNAGSIAAASHERAGRLSLLVMGLNDLALEMRLQPGLSREALRPALSQCILAARAYGLDILDGVTNRFDEDEILRADCQDGRGLGFDGKSLIHPAQIVICNKVFSASDSEIEQARALVVAAAAAGDGEQGAIKVDGMMVEALHLMAARRILAISGQD